MNRVEVVRTSTAQTRLLLAGAIAGPVFVTVFLVAGLLARDYDPLRHTVSSLALSDVGWLQTLNFFVDGALLVAFSVGLWRALRLRGTPSTAAPLLIGLAGVGLFAAGLFPTDPIFGYPPGAPTDPTPHGAVHDVLALVILVVGLPVAAIVMAVDFWRWGERTWALYSALTALLMLGGFQILGRAFGAGDASVVAVAGLIQRVIVVIGWGWISLLAIHLLGRAPAQESTTRAEVVEGTP
jgi:hypothetical protein